MTLPVDIRLPAWGDCALKVNNYAWREKEGHTHLVEDCPSALERFIFEYEDADPLKEKQFREMLLAVVVELTQPLTARAEHTAEVRKVVEDHCADLSRCVVIFAERDMLPTARQMKQAKDELEAVLAKEPK